MDVWEVDVTGLEIEDGPDGWLLCRTAIPAERVRLTQTDRGETQRTLAIVALSFASNRLSLADMTDIAGMEPDDVGVFSGAQLGLPSDDMFPCWMLQGSDQYAPISDQVTEMLARIEAAEARLTRLGAECARVSFWAHSMGSAGIVTWNLDPAALQLLARIHATPVLV